MKTCAVCHERSVDISLVCPTCWRAMERACRSQPFHLQAVVVWIAKRARRFERKRSSGHRREAKRANEALAFKQDRASALLREEDSA